jgi:hypothetical protein
MVTCIVILRNIQLEIAIFYRLKLEWPKLHGFNFPKQFRERSNFNITSNIIGLKFVKGVQSFGVFKK